MMPELSFHLWALVTVNAAAAILFASTELVARLHRRRSTARGPLPLDDWIDQMDQADGGDFLPRTADSCRNSGRAA